MINRRGMLAGSLGVFALSMLGCNDSGGTVSNQPAGTGFRANYLVSGNRGSTNVNVYSVNTASGLLTQVAGSPFPTGGATVFTSEVHPSGRFVYAGGFDTDEVIGYSLDPNSGALTALPGFPIATEDEPNVLIDRNGNFLYVAGQTRIDGFRINPANGTLTRLTGFPLPVPGMVDAIGFVLDPQNRFLYVGDEGSNTIFGFSIPDSGMLVPIGPVAAAAQLRSLGIDPSGRFLYASHRTGTITGYSIHPTTGVLTPLTQGFPVQYAPNGAINGHMAFRDRFVYLGDAITDRLNAFAIDPVSGTLSQLPNFPILGAGGGSAFAYPNTPFLYVSEFTRNRIAAYRIGGDGQLTLLGTSPSGTQPTDLGAAVFSF